MTGIDRIPPDSGRNTWRTVKTSEECEIYLAMLEAQTNNEENIAPVGEDLLGGPENPATDGAYYMGGVNNGLGLGKSFNCRYN
jgi:hypothetical protein